MAHNQAQWVTHVIDGGWATDYGSTFYATPDNGELRIPWCKTCENIKFFSDGSIGKYQGLFEITSSPITAPQSSNTYSEDSFVSNIFDYVSMASSYLGTRKRMAIVGSFLYDMTSVLDKIQVGDLEREALSVMHMSTFGDLLIIAGGTTPKSWDLTTFQNLAGTPPAFTFSTPHAGRHWAAGDASNPSRLYYSAVGNPEDWVGAGSGSIDIDPGDGDAITAILSWKKELWVFKGPYKLSIHRITGTSTSDFARTIFITGISAAGMGSIFPTGDDFSFWSPRGSCHSLTTTSNYGDYVQGYLNFPILSWCRNPLNVSNGFYSLAWQCITDAAQNVSYCVLNNHSLLDSETSIVPPVVIMMDWKFKSESNPYPRFSKLNLGKLTAVGSSYSAFDTSQIVPTFGTNRGRILQEYPPSVSIFTNADVAFPYTIETPAVSYGPLIYTKTLHAVSVDIISNFDHSGQETNTLEFSVGGRKTPAQTISFNQAGYVGLGTFVLGTDQLGVECNIPNMTEAISGESTAFSYTLREPSDASTVTGKDIKVRHFGVLISSSGEQMENP